MFGRTDSPNIEFGWHPPCRRNRPLFIGEVSIITLKFSEVQSRQIVEMWVTSSSQEELVSPHRRGVCNNIWVSESTELPKHYNKGGVLLSVGTSHPHRRCACINTKMFGSTESSKHHNDNDILLKWGTPSPYRRDVFNNYGILLTGETTSPQRLGAFENSKLCLLHVRVF